MAAVGELIVLMEGAPSGSMPVHSGDVLVLGRAPDCHVRIRLASVSRVSARLAVEGGHAFFVNASAAAPAVLTRSSASSSSSSSSTVMQHVEVPLGVPVCLQHGDRLAFGTRDFLFHYGAWGSWRVPCALPGAAWGEATLAIFSAMPPNTLHFIALPHNTLPLRCQHPSCSTLITAARSCPEPCRPWPAAHHPPPLAPP